MASIPAIVLDDLSEAKKRALMLADNRIAQSAGWDREQLSIEIAALREVVIGEGIDDVGAISGYYWVPSGPIWDFSILITMWRSEVSADGARGSTGSVRCRPA